MKVRTRLSLTVRKLGLGRPLDALLLRFGAGSEFRRSNRVANRFTDEVIRRYLGAGGRGLDVGAANGDVLAAMLAASPNAEHWAIEPQRDEVERLRARFPGVQVVHAACVDADRAGGTITLHVPRHNKGCSSIYEHEHPAAAGEERATTEVDTISVDSVVGGDQVALIKIDVEGAELDVLSGSLETLRRCRPVVLFEHQPRYTAQDPDRTRRLYDLLHTADYTIVGAEETGPLSLEGFTELATNGVGFFGGFPSELPGRASPQTP